MSKLNSTIIKKSIYSNGGNSDYSDGQTIQFQIPEKDGFLIPNSLNISFSFAPSTTCIVPTMALYAPILNLKTYLNDSCVEYINNYNKVIGLVVTNGLYDYSDRLGMSADYGLIYTGTVSSDGLSACTFSSTSAVGFSGKLECILSNFDSPVPLNKISPLIEINLDNFNRISNASGSFILSNVEISYDVLYMDFPIYKQLSTFSYFSNSSLLQIGTTGNFSLNFNNPKTKYAKGAFVTFSSPATTNQLFDSYDYTNFTGSYNLYFNNNKSFPQKTYFTSANKRSAILANYKEAIRKIYKNNNLNTFIYQKNFNYAMTSASTTIIPSKFIYGVPLCNDYCDGLDIDSNTAVLQISTTYSSSNLFLANLIICYGINIDITENGLIISK